jgi:hypothetical protein
MDQQFRKEKQMTKSIKLLVRILVAVILISGFLLIKRAFAEDYKTLSREYNNLYAALLVKKMSKIPTNWPVIVFLKDGSQVVGTFQGYEKYDYKVWVKVDGHFFSDAYYVNDLQDIDKQVKQNI